MDKKTLMLDPGDFVGVSFWILSAAMTAATFFFYMERDRAVGKWKTSLSVAALVTGIAGIHYFYMREVWVATGESPTVFRYVDWLLTVPLQIIEFYLILAAVAASSLSTVLATDDGLGRDACRWVPGRGRGCRLSRPLAVLCGRDGWLVVHRVRDLRR